MQTERKKQAKNATREIERMHATKIEKISKQSARILATKKAGNIVGKLKEQWELRNFIEKQGKC